MRRDDHERARSTDPNARHHSRLVFGLSLQNQHFAYSGGRVHNHPSGDPTPSRADIQMTKTIVDVAAPLGIAVHDHIIVGRHGNVSFKGLKLI
ncbi:MAG: hypothetical protein J0I45_00530 [Bosea sp.]|nr:hypothetical protein [Bosea sp. (in: a-proteobacteria)]